MTDRNNKVRVTHRSGRIGSAKHNDRSFLSAHAVWADNIDIEKTGQNRYWTWDRGWQGDEDIELSELTFYRERYGRSRQIINARYVADGHPERVRTTDDLYRGRLSRPEEMVLQIGDMYSDVDPEVFAEAVVHYLSVIGEWNNEHGGHMQLLSVALHFDESSPHAHIRRVWDYKDPGGVIQLGQNKALEAAGVALPDPEKKPGRYNNRKQTLDAMHRKLWQDIARDHGFEVEDKPRTKKQQRKETAIYKEEQIRRQDEALEQLSSEIEAKKAEKEAVISDLSDYITKFEGRHRPPKMSPEKGFGNSVKGDNISVSNIVAWMDAWEAADAARILAEQRNRELERELERERNAHRKAEERADRAASSADAWRVKAVRLRNQADRFLSEHPTMIDDWEKVSGNLPPEPQKRKPAEKEKNRTERDGGNLAR